MRELPDAIARGALARVSVLRDERLTRDAQHLLNDLMSTVDGIGGTVPSNPERYSPQEVLRERVEIERAFLVMRQNRREAIEEARLILAGVSERVGPAGKKEPYIEGEARRSLLSDIAVAFSQAGEELQAIRISEYVLALMDAPTNPFEIVEYVRTTSRGRRHRSSFAIQLQNLAVRRTTLAYLAALGGETDAATDLLNEAHSNALVSLELRPEEDTPRAVAGRLLSRSSLARIELEQAALVTDHAQRSIALATARDQITAVLTKSFETPVVRPRSRLIRAGDLGMVLVEQARLRAIQGDPTTAKSLAWGARAALKPQMDLYETDVDESPAKAVRYGEACRLCDDKHQARTVWQRSRDRLALFRGEEAPAVAALDNLLQSVMSA